MEKYNVTVTFSTEYESHQVSIETTNYPSITGATLRATGIIIDLANGSNLS